ncbi:unnamed protein product [Leptidea sinapis]|uniref:Ig-like domain-containing protein n=1 Tax=Leptidea sinapis TaxID=189913 RepID=A0A5E4R0J7_9NEOP|nr:unnamed protein product [Leptidea sinapis]
MRENNDHPIHATRELEVWYPPIVHVSPSNVTVREGSKILLKSEYESNPSSLTHVVWYRNGERLNVNSSHYEDVPQVRLAMIPESPILETEHKNVTLACEVVSGNPQILDEVIWYLDGEILKQLPECNGSDDPSMLLLQDTTKSFHGNYSCKGRNSAGWGNVSLNSELVVNYPPGPAKLTYSPWRVVKGKSLILSCSIQERGRPEAHRFRWHRGNRVVSDIVSQNWTIDPVTLDHRTNFSCHGINAAGGGEPAFNISLSCTVECAPLCSVQWLKDGQIIDPSKTDRYYVVERRIEPQVNRNDFEATESTLHWNMTAWPGGVLSRSADTARYSCRSSHEPENITVTPKVVSVIENEIPAKVTCAANYSWRREQPSKSTAKDHTNTSLILSSSNTLLLGPVARKDAGNYVCEAYNRHGAVNTTVFLDVMFVPECGIKQVELDGEQVLVCTAHANPSEVTFKWKLKNDNDSLTDEKIWDSNGQSYLRLSAGVEVYRTYFPKISDRTRLVDHQSDSHIEMNKFQDRSTNSLQASLTQLEATINANKVTNTESADDNEKQNDTGSDKEKPQTISSPNKWPLKPGVLVHVNSNHTLSPKNQARLQTKREVEANVDNNLGLLERQKNDTDANQISDTPKIPEKPRRTQRVMTDLLKTLRRKSDSSDEGSGRYKKINKTNKRAVTLMSLHKNYGPRKIKSLFQSETPNVIVTEGVVSFKRPDRMNVNARVEPLKENQITRKRKKPGQSPPTNGVDNAANGNLGTDNPGLYENLPFHGLQQPPNKPIQAIHPRIKETNTKLKGTSVESLQKQLTTNPSFVPRIVCPPFIHNAAKYPPTTAENPEYSTVYRTPVLSPIQQMFPLQQTVLLNPYLPPMPNSYLKRFPTIDEDSNIDSRKFSSLNTRSFKAKPPKFQSMRIVRKRNIERFYPNTEYGENFNEINNNLKNSESDDEKNDQETNIYENYPSLLRIKSDISGVERFENLTDSIQIYEETGSEENNLNASVTSLNRPIPAPRTKITPISSPLRTDHVYVNLSMPLISMTQNIFQDTVDAPIRTTRSEENISKFVPLKIIDNVVNTNDTNHAEKNYEDNDDNSINEKIIADKPNIVGATPKGTSIILPSTSLVKSVVNQLNCQNVNKVAKKQAITPKPLQIPKLTEKPVPKKSLKRSNSVASSVCSGEVDQNTNILQHQYLQKRNHFPNISSKGKNKKNFQIPLQKHHSFCYFQPIRVDKRIPVDQERSYHNTIGPVIYQPTDNTAQYYTKTLNRTREKNSQKLNRLKKSESLREKLSCVGVYDNYEKPNYPEPEYTDSERKSYLQLLKGNYISNSSRHIENDQYNSNLNTREDKKNKKLVYADLALGNHNLKFKNTVNSNRHLYDTYTIGNDSANKDTNIAYKSNVGSSQRKGQQRSEYATLKFNEIDV